MAIITFSRGSLSGVRDLAERVARRLQHECISREILVAAARDYGIDEREMTAAVAKPPSFWDRVTRNRQLYLKYVRAVLIERACSGRLVYHGHAGHLLLKEVPGVLRVRVIAPVEKRVEAAMIAEHLTSEEAAQYIQKVDKDRERWTKFLYNVDWHDPSLFDVTIHLEQMSMDTATSLVCTLAESPEYVCDARTLERLKNLALAAHVEAALQANPETRGVDVEAAAQEGVIRLSGNIETERLRPLILAVVQQVKGVDSVADEMVVQHLSRYPT
jgi:cytidylate kinase